MRIELNSFYKVNNGKYLYIHEITYYCLSRKIASIVTGDFCMFKSDSKTNVIRKVFTEEEFKMIIAEKKEMAK